MPEATPAPVTILPSTTTRSLAGMAPSRARCSIAAQWQVARLPWRRPAAASTSEPVQTEVTYFAVAACRCRNFSATASSMRSCWPGPPGTMTTSSCGQSAKVTVGTIIIPRSVFTGSSVWATRWTTVFGNRASTS
jgi:hypothetical protein